jgi:hypothetical protein
LIQFLSLWITKPYRSTSLNRLSRELNAADWLTERGIGPSAIMRETDINLSEERSAAISSMRGAAQRWLPGAAEVEARQALSEWSRDPQSPRILAESERKLDETEEGQKRIRLAQTKWSDSVEKLPDRSYENMRERSS